MEGLRGHTSGYAVPTYVIDAPGGGGKIPVMPNYLISLLGSQGRPAQLRGLHHDLRGARRRTSATTRRPAGTASRSARSPASPASWACSRASGCGSSRRASRTTHSRGNTEAHRLQDPSKWVPFGVGAIEGSAARPLRVLEGGEPTVPASSPRRRRRRARVRPRVRGRDRTRLRPGRGAAAARRRADRVGPRGAALASRRCRRAPRRARARSRCRGTVRPLHDPARTVRRSRRSVQPAAKIPSTGERPRRRGHRADRGDTDEARRSPR